MSSNNSHSRKQQRRRRVADFLKTRPILDNETPEQYTGYVARKAQEMHALMARLAPV
jgi:hypothetical protein